MTDCTNCNRLPITERYDNEALMKRIKVLEDEVRLKLRARDVLWCEALLKSWNDEIIDSRQMEKILRVFNERRPDKVTQKEESDEEKQH